MNSNSILDEKNSFSEPLNGSNDHSNLETPSLLSTAYISTLPQLQGWLRKEGKGKRVQGKMTSKERFFKQIGTNLFYYPSEDPLVESLGSIDLYSIQKVVRVTSKQFDLYCGKRTFHLHLSSKSEHDIDYWVDAISKWMNFLKEHQNKKQQFYPSGELRGWLKHHEGTLNLWKKRFFFQEGKNLWYYQSERTMEIPLGFIDLSKVTQVYQDSNNQITVIVGEMKNEKKRLSFRKKPSEFIIHHFQVIEGCESLEYWLHGLKKAIEWRNSVDSIDPDTTHSSSSTIEDNKGQKKEPLIINPSPIDSEANSNLQQAFSIQRLLIFGLSCLIVLILPRLLTFTIVFGFLTGLIVCLFLVYLFLTDQPLFEWNFFIHFDLPSENFQRTPIQHQTDWFNVLFSKFYQEYAQSPQYNQIFLQKLNEKLQKINRPGFIGEIQVSSVNFGQNSFYVYNPSVKEQANRSQVILFDLDYGGDSPLQITLTTRIILNWPRENIGVPISLKVSMEKLSGRCQLVIPSELDPKCSLSFLEFPDVKFSISSQVGSKNILSNIPRVTQFFQNKLHAYVQKEFTLPNGVQFSIPIKDVRQLRIRLISQVQKEILHSKTKEAISDFVFIDKREEEEDILSDSSSEESHLAELETNLQNFSTF